MNGLELMGLAKATPEPQPVVAQTVTLPPDTPPLTISGSPADRTLYDFVAMNMHMVPDGAQMYASYCDGADREYVINDTEFAKQFPDAVRLLIDVTGAHADIAQVADYEQGDMSLNTVVQWIQSYKVLHPGQLGTVYCSASNLDSLEIHAAKSGQHLDRDYYVWLAQWGNKPSEPLGPGIVAVQWKNNGAFDESVVFDANWHPGGGSQPKPEPFAAPERLSALHAAVEITWDAVQAVNGKSPDSYTVQIFSAAGEQVYETVFPHNIASVGLTMGTTYKVRVWANGGPVAPPHAEMTITL